MEQFVATTFEGLEEALGEELKSLGAQDVKLQVRAVVFHAPKLEIGKFAALSALSLRILMPLAEFEISKGDQVYAKAKELEWEKWLNLRQTFCVDSIVSSTLFKHTKYPGLVLKDAIVDRCRDHYGQRPDVDTQDPDFRFMLQIFGTHVRILADVPGHALFRRGYRRYAGEAPLNEVLAAGLVQLSGWTPDMNFFDPMTGSGTLLIEASRKLAKIPNVAPRVGWSYLKFPGFKNVEEFVPKDEPLKQPFLGGLEIEGKLVREARHNHMLARTGVEVEIRKSDFFVADPPNCEPGVMIINPPYDERIPLEDDFDFYKRIGDTLKQKYAGWKVWIFSANKEAMKHIGLRTSKRINLKNGPLECRFYCYEIR